MNSEEIRGRANIKKKKSGKGEDLWNSNEAV